MNLRPPHVLIHDVPHEKTEDQINLSTLRHGFFVARTPSYRMLKWEKSKFLIIWLNTIYWKQMFL